MMTVMMMMITSEANVGKKSEAKTYKLKLRALSSKGRQGKATTAEETP